MERPDRLRIGLVGRGAIGLYVAACLKGISGVEVAGLLVARAGGTIPDSLPPPVTEISNLIPGIDLLVECAGHSALRAHGAMALDAGIDVLSVSPGAMADRDLETSLKAACERGRARLIFVSGALGALDALAAAREGGFDRVRYTGRKPSVGWRGSPAEAVLDLDALTAPAEHFSGSARLAALRYPKNANVAALVAMAGPGFDATEVSLVADPSITANRHEVEAEGAFGRMSFVIEGRPLPGNPASSALAAMSVVAAIRRRIALVDPLPPASGE